MDLLIRIVLVGRKAAKRMPQGKIKPRRERGLHKKYQQVLIAYIISRAFTNEVATKGRISVSHSQWVKMANNNAAVDARKTSNQIPLYFFFCSIVKNLSKNRAAVLNQKKSFARGKCGNVRM